MLTRGGQESREGAILQNEKIEMESVYLCNGTLSDCVLLNQLTAISKFLIILSIAV